MSRPAHDLAVAIEVAGGGAAPIDVRNNGGTLSRQIAIAEEHRGAKRQPWSEAAAPSADGASSPFQARSGSG